MNKLYKKKYNLVLRELNCLFSTYHIQIYFLYLINNYVKNKSYSLIATKEEQICSVCCDILEERQISIQLNCKHSFHLDCISKWIDIKKSCPNCRKVI